MYYKRTSVYVLLFNYYIMKPEGVNSQGNEGLDQEFSSTTSRWFNRLHQSSLASTEAHYGEGSRKREDRLEYDFHYNYLRDQLSVLASPARLERQIEREGLKDTYGGNAKAVFVAESMGVLGMHIGRIEETKRDIENPNYSGDAEISREGLAQHEEAKKVFMKASEKLYGEHETHGVDLVTSLNSIGSDFEEFVLREGQFGSVPDAAVLLSGSLSWMNYLKELDGLVEISKVIEAIDGAISSLGESVGSIAWAKYEDGNGKKNYLSMPDDIKWVLAHGNEILYKLQTLKDAVR
ncbi:MAG: hypothetical protein ACI9VM_000099 [Candidatus Azotimanducaceae bacterium]|jgi:hypothetical protein